MAVEFVLIVLVRVREVSVVCVWVGGRTGEGAVAAL